MVVGSFPFSPGFNPYQRLFTQAIEGAGTSVVRIPPKKWFPLHYASNVECDLLHLDWPHDWYQGRNAFTRALKRRIYRGGLGRLRRKPAVWTAHNLVAHDAKDPVYEQRMIQALIDACRGIMVMSDAARNELQARFSIPSTVHVRKVFHGHYIDWYENNVSRHAARQNLEIPPNKTVFLSVGSIRPYKGHRSMIETFQSIATCDDILLIAGSGDPIFTNELQAYAAEFDGQGEVQILCGVVPDDRLQYFFNAADICVLPFRSVLNSGSLLLAMSFGLPVVAPKIGSIPEIACPDWYFGYSINGNEIKDRADAMASAKQRLGEVSLSTTRREVCEFTRERYCWSRIGTELSSWYRELAAEAPS